MTPIEILAKIDAKRDSSPNLIKDMITTILGTTSLLIKYAKDNNEIKEYWFEEFITNLKKLTNDIQ